MSTIRYDTVYLLVLKSWRYGQLNLAHCTETKNKEKLKAFLAAYNAVVSHSAFQWAWLTPGIAACHGGSRSIERDQQTDKHTHTYKQTDRPCYSPCSNIGRIYTVYFYDTACSGFCFRAVVLRWEMSSCLAALDFGLFSGRTFVEVASARRLYVLGGLCPALVIPVSVFVHHCTGAYVINQCRFASSETTSRCSRLQKLTFSS